MTSYQDDAEHDGISTEGEGAEDDGGTGSRPPIWLSGDLHKMTVMAERVMSAQSRHSPTLFRWGSGLGRVRYDPAPRIEVVGSSQLRRYLAGNMRWLKEGAKEAY